MKSVPGPLTDAELDHLDQFLSDRIDDDADTENKDVGIMGISELDGFLTAIVSGPETVLPSRWLPAVWGDFAPLWKNEKDFERVFSLLTRHMNGIARLLMAQPEAFEPLFLEHSHGDHTHTIVEDWCAGYLRGVSLNEERWSAGSTEIMDLLEPIQACFQETEEHHHELEPESAHSCSSHDPGNAVTRSARAIHAWWLARREPSEPLRRSEPRVGRNDLCPCGSGRKYKKCCLQ